MGQLNALGEGGINAVLTRRFNISGGPPSPTLEPAIFPSVVLENDRPEWGYPKGEFWYARRLAVTAGAGRSSVELFNPSRSALIVVREVEGSSTSTLQAKILVYVPGAAGTPAGGSFGLAMDGRQKNGSVTANSQAQITTDNVNALAGGNPMLSLTAALKYGPFILPPFTSLYVSCGSDAVAITYLNLVWTERRAEPGELV